MDLFYNASRTIKMVILVDLSAMFFGISTVNFSPFQGPNQFFTLVPQSDKICQYHNEYHMLSSFVRTLPVKFHELLFRLRKILMTLAVYTVNKIFLEGLYYNSSDHQEIHLLKQAFTSFHLTHYKCPERHFHNEMPEIDILIPDTLVSAILIFPVTLTLLTGFHASKRQEIGLCHENSSSLAKCSGDFKSPNNKLLYSNFEEYYFGDLFSFLFFVNACRSNHTRLSSRTL